MNWKSIAATASQDSLDVLENLLWDRGAVSVTVTDGGDNPLFEPGPGELPVWKKVTVTGLFEDDVDAEAIRNELNLEGFAVAWVEDLGDRIWEREWLDRFRPMRFGDNLWICPSGHEVDADDAVIIHLDPGLAFGTGTHPTTRLCLEWLDGQSLAGKEVVDYGCGSGVLAVGALLLGAECVMAIDNDPQAITATEENAMRNGVAERIQTGMPEEIQSRGYDIVLANILADPLRQLSTRLVGLLKEGGDLVMSGIMDSQTAWVMDAYRDEIDFDPEKALEGWVRLHGKKVNA